jgi:hypothetical protein
MPVTSPAHLGLCRRTHRREADEEVTMHREPITRSRKVAGLAVLASAALLATGAPITAEAVGVTATAGTAVTSNTSKTSSISAVQTAADRRYINRYLGGLPALRGPQPSKRQTGPGTQSSTDPMPSDLTAQQQGIAQSGLSRYECTTTPYSLTTNPQVVVTQSPDANKLWLGGLLQGRGYSNGLGSLRQLPIAQRAPLQIYISLLGKKDAVTVKNPNAANVQQAIGRLVQTAIKNHVPVPASIDYDQTNETNSTQALLSLGLSAKYLGASVDSKLDSTNTANESSVVAKFFQKMFTVSIVTPQTPADYFSHQFTKASLVQQEQLGRIARGNPPVVVSNITYGRMLLYSVTAKASTSDLQGALDAAYDGGVGSGSISVNAHDQQVLNSATYNVVAIGGSPTAAQNLIVNHQLGDYFKSQASLASAVPIAYQMDNIGNDSAASFGETTSYNETTCQAIANTAVKYGEEVRITLPDAYVNASPANPWYYGNLTVGTALTHVNWSVDRDPAVQIQPHTATPLTWSGDPNEGADHSYLDLELDTGALASEHHNPSSFSITGNVNNHLAWYEIGDDPVNTYTWSWNVNSSQPGSLTVDGGSAHADVQLKLAVTKLQDLYDYIP